MRRTLSSQSFSSVQKELHFGHQVNSTVQIQAGTPTITAADPLPSDLRQTLEVIDASPRLAH
jgi:hypothetical protein